MSHQRWHEWRNVGETTCPAHGVVRIVAPTFIPPDGETPYGGVVNPAITTSDNEVVGSTIILNGAPPGYDLVSDTEYHAGFSRGFSVHHAFNGSSDVAPGEIGLLTFDLPTWAAIGGSVAKVDGNIVFSPGDGLYTFGSVVTATEDWKAVSVVDPAVALLANTGCLYVLAGDETNHRVYVGGGVTYAIEEQDVI